MEFYIKLTPLSQIPYLGVIFDENLTFIVHIMSSKMLSSTEIVYERRTFHYFEVDFNSPIWSSLHKIYSTHKERSKHKFRKHKIR